MRRDKTPLLLLEQMVTLLVFAVAAAICLQVFVAARLQSQDIAQKDRAAGLCQNTAEALRATGGDVATALAQVSGVEAGQREGFGYFVPYDDNWEAMAYEGQPLNSTYTLQVRTPDSGVAGLGTAEIQVYRWQRGEMASLFRLETAWQEEVGGNG